MAVAAVRIIASSAVVSSSLIFLFAPIKKTPSFSHGMRCFWALVTLENKLDVFAMLRGHTTRHPVRKRATLMGRKFTVPAHRTRVGMDEVVYFRARQAKSIVNSFETI